MLKKQQTVILVCFLYDTRLIAFSVSFQLHGAVTICHAITVSEKNGFIVDGIIFNWTSLLKLFEQESVKATHILIIPKNKQVIESYSLSDSADKSSVQVKSGLQNGCLTYCGLTSHNQHLFYQTVIDHATLFQYQLCAKFLAIDFLGIFTQQQLFFYAYHGCKGSLFSHTQLALDIEKYKPFYLALDQGFLKRHVHCLPSLQSHLLDEYCSAIFGYIYYERHLA